MNRHINQSRCERYIMPVEFWRDTLKKALLCYVLVYQKSKRELSTYEILETFKVQHHNL